MDTIPGFLGLLCADRLIKHRRQLVTMEVHLELMLNDIRSKFPHILVLTILDFMTRAIKMWAKPKSKSWGKFNGLALYYTFVFHLTEQETKYISNTQILRCSRQTCLLSQYAKHSWFNIVWKYATYEHAYKTSRQQTNRKFLTCLDSKSYINI